MTNVVSFGQEARKKYGDGARISYPVPKVADEIYVPPALHLFRGVDDVEGGKARVSTVEEGISGGLLTHYISVEEHPGVKYNWTFLGSRQEELQKRYGQSRAHPTPDYSPEFNN